MEGAYAEDIASGSRRRDRSTRLRHGSARPTRRRAALGGVSALPRRAWTARSICPRAGVRWLRRISPASVLRTFLLLRRSEEHTSELQSLMRISYAVFCLTKKRN